MTDDDDKFSTMMGVEEHKTHILTITNNKLYFDQNRETFKELFENLGKIFSKLQEFNIFNWNVRSRAYRSHCRQTWLILLIYETGPSFEI